MRKLGGQSFYVQNCLGVVRGVRGASGPRAEFPRGFPRTTVGLGEPSLRRDGFSASSIVFVGGPLPPVRPPDRHFAMTTFAAFGRSFLGRGASGPVCFGSEGGAEASAGGGLGGGFAGASLKHGIAQDSRHSTCLCSRAEIGPGVTGELGVGAVPKKAPKQRREMPLAKVNGLRALRDEAFGTGAGNGTAKDNVGGIHLIVGPMFAGKSTTLLRRVQQEAANGRNVALVKSDKDTRYGLSSVVTHDGMKMPCYAVSDLATFKSKIGQKAYEEVDVIAIDEAQFFVDLYEFCLYAADFDNKTVIAAGLDGDFLRRRFGSTLDLIPVADSVVKLTSRCEICAQPAIFTLRKTLDIHTTLVGGSDVYMAVCRQHFVNGQIAVETGANVIDTHKVIRINKE